MSMSVGEQQPRRTDSGQPVTIGRFRYLRAPQPVHFPESAEVPESRLHEALCALLRALLRHAFATEHSVGGDQFVYWDPTDPRACLAPDVFVRLGRPDSKFRSWKVWEHGAPDVAIEILGESDLESWDTKLAKYMRLGVRELVAFDPESPSPTLRVWDRLENDLVERELGASSAASNVLPGYWVVVLDPEHGAALRLSHDAAATALFPTPTEAANDARRAETEARLAAEARVRELETELARRQG
jgi:hypothetical protein